MQPIQLSPQLPVQQTIVYVIPQTVPIVDAYASRRSVVNGILQIIVGAFCIIVNSISLGIGIGFGSVGHGYWGGVFYIITGSIGIAAGKKMSKCLIIAFMVLCIVAASLIAPGHLAAAITGSVIFSFDIGHDHYNHYNSYNGEFGTQVTLSILALIEFAFAVWGSAIWCKAVGCCCNDIQTATPVQLVQISNGQPIVLVQASGGQYVPQNLQPPQYSNYPAPVNQGYHMLEKVQPNNHHDVTNSDPVGTYQRFA